MKRYTIWFKMSDYSTVMHKERAHSTREALAKALRNPPRELLGYAEIKRVEIEADED